MRLNTHNGFVLRYDGPFFPATSRNQITYDCFCLMGGLSNDRLFKYTLGNGRNSYHRVEQQITEVRDEGV